MANMDASHCRTNSGTLLWVGPRETAEFRPIFDFCVESTAQVAWRNSIEDALRRPADQVRSVLLVTADRSSIDPVVVDRLVSQHEQANAIQLFGPLCVCDRSNNAAFPQAYWYQWNQCFEELLAPCGLSTSIETPATSAKSVAVIADTAGTAEPLLDVATSCAATVIWCRRPSMFGARNFDVVWWDDSVAQPACTLQWRRRIAAVHSAATQTHVWLTNIPQTESVRAARQAGVDVVLSKPTRIESLMATMGTGQHAAAKIDFGRSRAA